MEEIENACKTANIYDFIEKQETGLDTIVGNRGLKLSGGEKQRVNFLRAVLNNAPVVLLDEPFSSLDLSTKIPLMNEFVKILKQYNHAYIKSYLTGDRKSIERPGEEAFQECKGDY